MNLNAKVVTKKSAKTGNEYTVVEIQLTPTLSKDVFLEKAELEVLKMMYDNKN